VILPETKLAVCGYRYCLLLLLPYEFTIIKKINVDSKSVYTQRATAIKPSFDCRDDDGLSIKPTAISRNVGCIKFHPQAYVCRFVSLNCKAVPAFHEEDLSV
jgi:hypothetical protein